MAEAELHISPELLKIEDGTFLYAKQSFQHTLNQKSGIITSAITDYVSRFRFSSIHFIG
jgi:hypothetical protein